MGAEFIFCSLCFGLDFQTKRQNQGPNLCYPLPKKSKKPQDLLKKPKNAKKGKKKRKQEGNKRKTLRTREHCFLPLSCQELSATRQLGLDAVGPIEDWLSWRPSAFWPSRSWPGWPWPGILGGLWTWLKDFFLSDLWLAWQNPLRMYRSRRESNPFADCSFATASRSNLG